jgi:hypothetical protein
MTYPLLCPRCQSVTITSAVENCGTPDAPLCIVCYFETVGEPDTETETEPDHD